MSRSELDTHESHDRDVPQPEERILQVVLAIQALAQERGDACAALLNAKMAELAEVSVAYHEVAPILSEVAQVKLDVARLQSIQDRQDSMIEDPSPFLRKVLRNTQFFKDEN